MGGISTQDAKELERWFVGYSPTVNQHDVEELRKVIEAANDEAPIQQHLEANPALLGSILRGGHGRWVRPRVAFGDVAVADFVIADGDSAGFNWRLIELESPIQRAFLNNGEWSEKARHAIFQIKSWRNYIGQFPDKVRRRPSEGGLGLRWITPKTTGIVLIGRKDNFGPDLANLRQQSKEDDRIHVHSYDWLIDQLESVAGSEDPLVELPGHTPQERTAQLDELGR